MSKKLSTLSVWSLDTCYICSFRCVVYMYNIMAKLPTETSTNDWMIEWLNGY